MLTETYSLQRNTSGSFRVKTTKSGKVPRSPSQILINHQRMEISSWNFACVLD